MQKADDSFPVSPKSKVKTGIFSYCLGRNHQNDRQVLSSPLPPQAASSSNPTSDENPTLISHNKKDHKDEIMDRCVKCFKRMGSGINKHRRCNSTEFGYDPLSYSLNFEDDGLDRNDEAHLGNFCSRLPASPPDDSVAVRETKAPH